MSSYEENRARIPAEDLRRLAGNWVAFSADGSRILGSSNDLLNLEAILKTAGIDPEGVALERIELEDIWVGGAETL